jgi:hypothetical protein
MRAAQKFFWRRFKEFEYAPFAAYDPDQSKKLHRF